MSAGISLLSALLASERGLEKFVNMSLEQEFFVGDEADVYTFITGHVQKFGALPAKTTAEKETQIILDATIEPPEYYLEQVEKRYTHNQLKLRINEAVDALKEKEPERALQLIAAGVQKLLLKKNRKEIVDMSTQGLQLLKDEYKKKLLLGDEYGIQTGWPYLDDMMGGLQPGDLLSITGRPSAGKSYLALYMARHAWHHQKKIPLFISMEMKPLLLIQRIAALHSSIPITKLKQAQLSTPLYKKMVHDIGEMTGTGRPFWIVDGNLAATVSDIAMIARQLKPDVIFIDGAYLLQAASKKTSDWERVKSTVEDVKQVLASQLNVPVVCSYQLNREATKKKKEGAGVEHIASTDAIGQISSIVLGLFEDENIESLMEKTIEIMKGRSGEVGRFKINWVFDNFPYMAFDQKKIAKLEDLSFL